MGSIPAGSTKIPPLALAGGRNFGISIGEDLPHEVRRFAPTQSAQGRSPKYSRREYHFLIPGIDHHDVGSVVKVVEYGGVSGVHEGLHLLTDDNGRVGDVFCDAPGF